MGVVSYRHQDGVGVITIDHPPVNALSQAVRAGLMQAAADFAADDAAGAAVLICAGRSFVAGADISEFGKPPQAPFLPDVINAIEALDKPVVAAIHGTALGGGLELAMGAHHRISAASARMGLPECTLGILPGAGGTQRLPRLAGLALAAEAITSARQIGADEALAAGLVDAVVPDAELTAAAMAAARRLTGTAPRRTRDLPAPAPDPALIDRLRAGLPRSAPGQVAQGRALDAIAFGLTHSFDEGLAHERATFVDLMQTPQRAALVHAFFAERKVAQPAQIAGIAPRAFERIGVIGGGTMGAGIATACLLAGLHVTLIERDAPSASAGADRVAGMLTGAVDRGKLTPLARDAAMARFHAVSDYAPLAQADIIIEAVFEKLDVKQQVFAQIDAVARPGAVLATNTSYLDVNLIAQATARPGDVIGLHFFSPAHVMKLLEIVVADATQPDVVATGFALAKRLKKIAVRAGVCDGFIGNRILNAYRKAADAMVLDGADPAQIDRVVRAFGFPMGPYQVSDLAGLDIGYFNRQRQAATRDPRERVPVFADRLYERGHLGRKTGRGYYIYDAETPNGRPDPDLPALLDAVRTELRLTPRAFSDDQIIDRYMAAMVNEAAKVVEEGIAQRPLDVDVTLLHGYGFPRAKGGPLHWADAQGLAGIAARLRDMAAEDPVAWQPSALLLRLADQGGRFADLNG
ncbi:FAD-dependent oxidoreductase [Paracoccus sp. p4-l81]|uniref:FAD-dependent oxidoreductase n=1 Tax=Paracoccus sp. p4-l81 TaxID=3342806 RepID=UPI0035BB3213